MRAATYVRVSTAEQEPGTQLRQIQELAAARGWPIVREFSDVGWSGAHVRRPGLEAMLADAARRRFDVVLVWDLSRFARSALHALQLLQELNGYSVRLVTVRQDFDTDTPLGRAFFTLAAMFAELEREILRERVRAGMERARAEGKRFGRPRREVDAAKLAALRASGLSIRAIGRKTGLAPSTVAQKLKELGRTEYSNTGDHGK